MREELTTFIIKELGKPLSREEIIRRVCKKCGLKWKDAERLVILIEARYYRTSATRHTPVLLFLSIAALVGGIGLLAFNMEILLTLFQKDITRQILSLGSTHFFESLGGLAMTIVGTIGLWKALGYIFPNRSI